MMAIDDFVVVVVVCSLVCDNDEALQVIHMSVYNAII